MSCPGRKKRKLITDKMKNNHLSKKDLAQQLGISRASLYYQPKLPQKDWQLKTQIEQVLHTHPSYGHKRIALALGINRKRVLRVMKLFGIKPYRRRVRKPRKKRDEGNAPAPYPNLLLKVFPSQPHAVWVSDFTYIPYRQRFIYLATVMDIFTRRIVGFNILTAHNTELVKEALLYALLHYPKPDILHSDQGREYTAKEYINLVNVVGIKLSMSHKSCPWENGYQESFYSQFKVDLGNPHRFDNLGELVWNIYKRIHIYNQFRIHTKLKMPPAAYARRHQLSHLLL